MKKSILAIAILATMSTGEAIAAPVAYDGVYYVDSALGQDYATTPPGLSPFYVDDTISAYIDESAGTWGVSSTAPFYGLNWTASGGTLISSEGSYALDTATGVVTSTPTPDSTIPWNTDGIMHFTVGENEMAGLINWAWGASTNIRIINVWDINPSGSLSAIRAPGMENGPFPGFNMAFNLTPVPIPAAVWLFGSGLIGLIGVARRKANA